MITTEYNVATGSITGPFIKVKRFTVPVYPDNDGNLWYRDARGNVVYVRD